MPTRSEGVAILRLSGRSCPAFPIRVSAEQAAVDEQETVDYGGAPMLLVPGPLNMAGGRVQPASEAVRRLSSQGFRDNSHRSWAGTLRPGAGTISFRKTRHGELPGRSFQHRRPRAPLI